ncbi:MAG: TatD family hydrolase [Bacteroides cellulosilyticus]|nr:TatD family hydrolase [Bacteroides cellulosilyticus]
MNSSYINIHTHRPTGRSIELRTIGIHPWDAESCTPEEALRKLTAASDAGDAQAVGEIGFDFARAATPEERNAQAALFRAQLAWACERDLPVVLHCVRAFEPTMRLLHELTPRAVIFHGFIGSPQQARQAVQRGYFLSFGERSLASPRTVEALRSTPLRQLFLETDESPTPIEEVYARAAALLGTSVGTLQRTTTENYERIFSDDNG